MVVLSTRTGRPSHVFDEEGHIPARGETIPEEFIATSQGFDPAGPVGFAASNAIEGLTF